jgi:hypothetical protein
MKMFQYHVFYEDGWPSDGDVGLSSFKEEQEALDFIQDRMTNSCARHVENYMLIKGKILDLKAVEVVTKIIVEK